MQCAVSRLTPFLSREAVEEAVCPHAFARGRTQLSVREDKPGYRAPRRQGV